MTALIRLTSSRDKFVHISPAAISGLGIQRDDGCTPVFVIGEEDPFIVCVESAEQVATLIALATQCSRRIDSGEIAEYVYWDKVGGISAIPQAAIKLFDPTFRTHR